MKLFELFSLMSDPTEIEQIYAINDNGDIIHRFTYCEEETEEDEETESKKEENQAQPNAERAKDEERADIGKEYSEKLLPQIKDFLEGK